MNFKSWFVAAAMFVGGAAAHANDYTLTLSPTSGTKMATAVYDVATTGTFTDLIQLVPSAGTDVASVGLASVYASLFSDSITKDISGLSATLMTWNGSDWLSTGTTGTSFSNLILNAGTLYALKVTGTATGTIGGTYVVGYLAAAVPEPASVALFLAGLGALGLVARRRKIAEKEPVDAALA